jgi:WD40 repeat protein
MKKVLALKRWTSVGLIIFACSLCWAQKPELVVQTGHSGQIFSVAVSPDGKILASGSFDHNIKLWDVSTGVELRVLTGHSFVVESVAFSPDGKTLASASWDRTAKLWDVSTGAVMFTFKGHSAVVNSVAFSPDGKILATGSADHTIRLWDASSGAELRLLKGHAAEDDTSIAGIPSVAFSPDGKILASGGDDHTVRIWDVSTGALLHTLTGHTAVVHSVAFSPDGNVLVSGSGDHFVKLWDVAKGVELRTLPAFPSYVASVAFSPDGKILAIAGGDKTITLWDVPTGKELRTLKGHPYSVESVAFSPNGKTLASGYEAVRLWDVSTGAELRRLEGHSNSVHAVAFSPDGKIIASGHQNIRLWDVSTGSESRLICQSSWVSALAFSPDGKLLACGGGDNTVQILDLSTGAELHTLKGHSSEIRSVAFRPDSKIVASSSDDQTVKLWDVSTGAELRTLTGHSDSVRSVAFSPDGKILASGSWDSSVKLWDVSTGAQLRSLDENMSRVYAIAFSPDGKSLAAASRASIKLWDVSTGAELKMLIGHSSWVESVAFSAQGNILASGGSDNTIRLWDVSSGTGLGSLRGHSSDVSSLAFSRDGKYLVSGSSDMNIKVWEAPGNEVASLVAVDQSDWLVVTPDGLFDGSPASWSKTVWRFNNNTFDHAPIEAFFNEYYYPGLLADIFSGKRPKSPPDIAQKDRRQPRVTLTRDESPTNPNAASAMRNLKVIVRVADADKDQKAGSGAQDVRLFRNGSLVKVWRGDVLKGQNNVTLEATVPIVGGENKFTAYAFNHDNIKSSDAELTVTGTESLRRQGIAYVLAIGVNNYANGQYNLKYAVADAEDFSAEVKRQQEALKRYARVEVIPLANEQATKPNITQKLAYLAKQVQPEDAVIVFFAGHGTAQGNRFYLIPHDLGYDGPREPISKAGLQTILDHSISDRELEKLFEGIDAGQLLLVIDACNSGQALEAEEKRRGPMNSKGLAQLAYEKGMYVLTAAQSYQAAQEAAKFGHGFLTYALVEAGLKQGAADREPKNGSIDIREWLNFATDEVPKMQEENSADALRGRGRLIIFVGDGSPNRTLERDKNVSDNVQRPRVFYRRELEANPLVVGVASARP